MLEATGNSPSIDRGNGTRVLLWVLVLIYGAARFGQAYPERIPMVAIVALHVLPALLFALVHGALRHGVRGILIFSGLSIAIGNLTENLSILTGFPFGHYHFTDVMGPRLFQVPILLGLAYIGMGYLSWTLGVLIAGDIRQPLAGHRVATIPLVASFIMVAWDYRRHGRRVGCQRHPRRVGGCVGLCDGGIRPDGLGANDGIVEPIELLLHAP